MDAVTEHRPKTERPSEIEYKVSWSDGDTTWEPACALTKMDKFKEYNKAHKLVARAAKQATAERRRVS